MDNSNAATVNAYTFTNPLVFSQGKNPPRNEDSFAHNKTTLVVSDGETDKSGQDFNGRTGGEIASELVTEVCLSSKATGIKLINEISNRLREVYAQTNPKALEDSSFRFAATLVTARIVNDEVIITQVGDSSFRINGTDVYLNNKLVDQLTANARKAYIEETGDIAGSRDFIMPLLKTQHRYRNNPDLPLGYAVIDGTPVPNQFVKIYKLPASSVHTIEFVSDGYYSAFPDTVSIEAYETLHRNIEKADPNKCRDYASTKLSDDRTGLISTLR